LLKAKISAVKFGDRATDASLMGPLVNASSRQNIHAMVERAVSDGAVLEAGGFIPEGNGHFYPPTLLSNCRQDM
jgi:lactaldehyde dehydrogenase/glycolaldehyde dehydrogenase